MLSISSNLHDIESLKYYIRNVAHCDSLSRHGTATERSKNATSSVHEAPAYITTPTGSIPNAHNGYAVVVLSTVLTNKNFRLATYKYQLALL